MEYNKILCPQCSGKLKVSKGQDLFKCPYCGATIEYDEETEEASVRDEAEEEKSSVSAKKKKKKNNAMIALGVTFGVILLALVAAYIFRHQIINLFTEPEYDPNPQKPFPETSESASVDTAPDQPDDGKDRVYNFLICGHDRVADNTASIC